MSLMTEHPRSLGPMHGVHFLLDHGIAGLFALGAVFLAVTGAEALYADMGHFGASPSRWCGSALCSRPGPQLPRARAMLLAHPERLENSFYLLYPSWALIPVIVLASIATIIASQAVITGAFSLTQQAIQFGLLPRSRFAAPRRPRRGRSTCRR